MIKKRVLAIILCVCMCLPGNMLSMLLQVGAEEQQTATSGTCGEQVTWTFDDTTGILSFGGEGVVNSRKGWAAFHENIKSIYIGQGVTGFSIELHGSAFVDTSLKNLEQFEVETGNLMFSTMDGVLFNYDQTELIYYPTTRAGGYTIPDGTIKIGNRAFERCRQLTAVNISDSVQVIGQEAFSPCPNLKEVQIGRGVKYIEKQAFSCCRTLQSIVIPENVESIGYKAFEDCSYEEGRGGLQSVIIKGKDTKMLDSRGTVNEGFDAGTFSRCTELKEVSIACNIGQRAFEDCTALTDVIVTDGASEIGYAAFSGCKNLTNIQLPDSLKKIDNDVFQTDKITEFYIPANLEEMNGAAVRYCNNLTNFIVDEKNNNFKIKDGVLFDSSFSVIIKYPQQKKDLSEYEVPAGVNKICNGAFYGCHALTEIILPKEVKTVDRYAFADCPSLKYMVIPEGVQTLKGPMFHSSNSLEYIAIPQSVTDIGSGKNANHLLEWVDFNLDVYCYSTDYFSNYEEYKRLDNGVKLIYDSNGGNSDITEQVVYTTRTYENMPVPTRKGYTFSGWYTQKDGGRKITDSSIVDQIADYTLYAHWEGSESPEDPDEEKGLEHLSYSFGNNNQAFGYGWDYQIPLKIFQNIWGDTAMAKYWHIQQGSWRGNCYGMAATSGMFNTKSSGAEVQKFNVNANEVCDLKIEDLNSDWNMNVCEFIETLFVSQNNYTIQREYHDNKDKLSELCNIVKNGKELLLIAVFGAEGGHALLGYRLEDVDAVTARLYVYDCNYPLQERFITLTKNASGEYIKWYYYLNNRYDWGTGYNKSWISYVSYDKYVSEWNNSAMQKEKAVNMLYVNASDVIIENAAGNEIARFVDNELQTERADIVQVRNTGMTSDHQTKKEPNIIYIPKDTYSIKNLDANTDIFNVQFVNKDFGIQATTSADQITVLADDEKENSSVFIDADSGDTYNVKLDILSGKMNHTVQVQGECMEKMVGVELDRGLVSLTNCSEDNMLVQSDGNNVKYYAVDSQAEQGGMISPSGTYYAIQGAKVNYRMDADTGYELKDVLVDGNSIGAIEQYELKGIDADHKILAKFAPKNVLIENIKLNVTNTSVQNKDTLKLEATIVPENATNKELEWISENNHIAKVDNTGIVMAVETGQTTITVKAKDGSGIEASCIITVTKKPDNGSSQGGNTSGSVTPGGNTSGSGTGGNTSGSNSGGSSFDGVIPNGNASGGGSSGGKPNSGSSSDGNNDSGNHLVVKLSYYIVSFHENAGTGLSRKTMTLLMDDMLGILPKVQRKNYKFNGWYTQQSGGTRVYGSTILNAATTLYAQWTKVAKPMKVSSLKLSSEKDKKLTVSFKKVTGAAGYQIVYSTDQKFKEAAAKKLMTSSASKTIKNLKKNKTYYVKVRAFKTDSAGNKIYGAYSTHKKIKI